MQTINNSVPYYHQLFETFRDEVLHSDAEKETLKDANLKCLFPFSVLDETQSHDAATPSANPPAAPEDRLFSFNINLYPTEKPVDIDLPGIDQLPAIIEEQIQRISAGLIPTTLRAP